MFQLVSPLLCYRGKNNMGVLIDWNQPQHTHTSSQTLSQVDSGLQGDDDTEGEKQENINM